MDKVDVVIGKNSWLNFQDYKNKYHKILVVVDSKITNLYPQYLAKILQGTNHQKFLIFHPENEKNLSTIEELTKKALEFNLTRYDCLLAIGGGAVGDLAAFFSSIYKRGIDFYNFPTTLIAQVDSAIGGKTALNFYGFKNQLGSFYLPKGIFVDPQVLKSLEEGDFYGGLGEVAKYALLEQEFFDWLIENLDLVLVKDLVILEKMIDKSIKIKEKYVKGDIMDTKGQRIALNLGHTLGHLIENQPPDYLNHGLSVLIGLDFALHLSYKLQILNKNSYLKKKLLIDKLLKVVRGFELTNYHYLLNKVLTDKKVKGENLQFVAIGEQGFKVVTLDYNHFQKLILEYSGDFYD
ncbi:3-dehydroquinate synthase [Anaerobranca californiensis DSM 14826]|jgi:3-dehydroquinate synthase|uniref:3-dehydroquinate synthase n=1 Tax=Anaerobranca californiensis DSM 14826 TaxID=1120989 RepID=A0A1M6KSQ0_9FIRM|nr:3-dehydroquinate synthase family protein [Anaerobranca californiensis]SHJ61904.1 3-dehydroquinate synthase [Anaerobranca californiensis DSM 14826]